jgi:hypothetical protein
MTPTAPGTGAASPASGTAIGKNPRPWITGPSDARALSWEQFVRVYRGALIEWARLLPSQHPATHTVVADAWTRFLGVMAIRDINAPGAVRACFRYVLLSMSATLGATTRSSDLDRLIEVELVREAIRMDRGNIVSANLEGELSLFEQRVLTSEPVAEVCRRLGVSPAEMEVATTRVARVLGERLGSLRNALI